MARLRCYARHVLVWRGAERTERVRAGETRAQQKMIHEQTGAIHLATFPRMEDRGLLGTRCLSYKTHTFTAGLDYRYC
jgi:hypothetical protein